MKKKKNYLFLALAIPFIIAVLSCLPSCYSAGDYGSNEITIDSTLPHFTKGQILLPDYACSDTLIVVDADGLNKALDNYEGLEGDAGCDSLFHHYCTVK